MFGRKDDTEKKMEKVQRAVQSTQVPNVTDLSTRQNGNVVEIHGRADSMASKQAAFEKITNQLGDADGVVNFIQIASEKSQPQAAGMQFPNAGNRGMAGSQQGTDGRNHTVKKGETLSHIAQHYYGKAGEYMKIYNANTDQLNDPDKIREGMTLKIPQ